MKIEYNHAAGVHTLDGPRAVMPRILAETKPQSLLDVGCGTGTWLRAATDLGVADVFGVDGISVPADQLLIPSNCVQIQDLTKPLDLGRRFDAAICLEVAEHLDEPFAGTVIDTLVRHADVIYFSAACPGQPGQHHVNCQWPAYWQQLFNERGYACNDEIRWQIWDDSRVQAFYRQNLFTARRAPEAAGKEPRLRSVVHYDAWIEVTEWLSSTVERHSQQIEQGSMPPWWYVTVVPQALGAKLARSLKRSKAPLATQKK